MGQVRYTVVRMGTSLRLQATQSPGLAQALALAPTADTHHTPYYTYSPYPHLRTSYY